MRNNPKNTRRPLLRRSPALRPASLALAIAAAFCTAHGLVFANPSGGQVIAGQASFSAQGNSLVVTTQNAQGTSSSAINWQSFSIPAGSSTRFIQPSATSTVINRVLSRVLAESDQESDHGTTELG